MVFELFMPDFNYIINPDLDFIIAYYNFKLCATWAEERLLNIKSLAFTFSALSRGSYSKPLWEQYKY